FRLPSRSSPPRNLFSLLFASRSLLLQNTTPVPLTFALFPARKVIRAPLRFALVTSPGIYSRSASLRAHPHPVNYSRSASLRARYFHFRKVTRARYFRLQGLLGDVPSSF